MHMVSLCCVYQLVYYLAVHKHIHTHSWLYIYIYYYYDNIIEKHRIVTSWNHRTSHCPIAKVSGAFGKLCDGLLLASIRTAAYIYTYRHRFTSIDIHSGL